MDGGAWWAAVHGVAKSRTRLSDFAFTHWRRKWQPTPCSCLENPGDGRAWWAAVYGVAQSRTRLKRLSSSSSSSNMLGSEVHGIFQARVLQWGAISFARGSSRPRDRTQASYFYLHWQVGSLPLAPPGKPGEQVFLALP